MVANFVIGDSSSNSLLGAASLEDLASEFHLASLR
jgi:hypothetical protein